MNSTTRVASILGLALVASFAAACSNDGGPPRAVSESTAAPTATAEAASAAQRTGTSSAPRAATTTAPATTDLSDGVHVAHVVRVNPGARWATVDVIQFLTGEAATRAAAEDDAEVPPPNDYYIRNTSSRLRTLSVTSDAPITINVHGAQESGSSTKDIPKTLAQLADIEGLENGVFRLTLQDGQLTRIAEVFLP
jgi:hypothetical protein